MALILKHQTPEQFIARFRDAYRASDRNRLARLARFLLSKIASGDITDLQARNAFGLTVVQWTTMKTKMQNLVIASDAVQSAVGE